jgi:exodeoxyribonuclease VII small subunit
MPDLPCDAPTFEQALADLESIVRELEDGKIGLEESLARYEQGVALLKRCYGQLRQVEQKIALLTGVDGDGNPLTKPFDHSASMEPARDPKKP